MTDLLSEAIRVADLPEIIHEHFPNFEIHKVRGSRALVSAPYREDKNPSFSLFKASDGTWLWKDHGTGKGGNAFTFLVEIVGLPRKEAAQYLKRRAGLDWEDPSGGYTYEPGVEFIRKAEEQPPPREDPKPQLGLSEKERRLWAASRRNLKRSYPEYLKVRGIPPKVAEELGLGVTREGDLVVPIRAPSGRVEVLKIRRRNAERGKYRYTHEVGTTPWLYLPGFQRRDRPVLVVEGEINAIAAWAAARDLYAVVGSAGASTPVDHPEAFKGRRVFIYADGDEAGERAKAEWSAQLAPYVSSIRLLPPVSPGSSYDFADFLGERGRGALREWILTATQTQGATARS